MKVTLVTSTSIGASQCNSLRFTPQSVTALNAPDSSNQPWSYPSSGHPPTRNHPTEKADEAPHPQGNQHLPTNPGAHRFLNGKAAPQHLRDDKRQHSPPSQTSTTNVSNYTKPLITTLRS